jgi:hypothetical protein
MANYDHLMRISELRGWHVYVLAEEGDAFCKIGTTSTPHHSIQQLQNGNPRQMRVVADWHFASRALARSVESKALDSAGLLRLERRNWLECSPEAAVGFVKCAMARLGIEEEVTK